MTDTTTRLLRRLIDDPGQIALVRSLDEHRFSALVQSIGMEDVGELLAMATPAQMLTTLDEALWRGARPGDDEDLDTGRFAVWLEVVLESGDAHAAQRLAEIPEELLIAGLCGQLFVFPLDVLGHEMAGASWHEAEVAERVLDEALHLEFDRYTLVARHGLGWDPTIAALLALDARDHDRVVRVLDACCRATTETLTEGDGWQTVLSAQETIEVDAAADRENRRARRGYVTPADAASFLALADQTSLVDDEALAEDPVTHAYFRELDHHAIGPALTTAMSAKPEEAGPRLRALLADIDASELTSHPLPVDGTPEVNDMVDALRDALVRLQLEDREVYDRQMARLTYLANVLVAAGRPDGDPYTPVEAGCAALEHCARGLHDVHGGRRGKPPPWEILHKFGADGLFRRGWRLRAK